MDQNSFANLAGKNALVTGSSSGIGRAIAVEFARAGANLLLHCRKSQQAAEEVVQQIQSMGQTGQLIVADLTNEDAPRKIYAESEEMLGKIDVLVNNAGTDLLTGNESNLSYEQKLCKLFEVDIRSTTMFSKLAGENMVDRKQGTILNIGWDQDDRGMEGDSGELFALAKNAIMGLTRSLAVSLAPHVRVNCIAPGWIQTAWGKSASEKWQNRVIQETPLGRWGKPEDIAKMARFLCSDEADFMTGQIVNVNGGAVR